MDALGFRWGSVNASDGVKDIRWSPEILRVCEDVQNAFMAKIESRLVDARIERVWIIPDGELHRIPLHSANVVIEGKRRYFMDHRRVDFAPGWEAIGTRSNRRKLSEHRALLVGSDPHSDLVCIGQELRRIETILRGAGVAECVVLRDRDAVRARVVELLPQFSLIHVASHGLFNIRDVGASGLLLWDGVLSCRDIASIRLKPESLVALSGCKGFLVDQTVALAKHLSPAGSFLTAGAATVVASLFDVPDGPTAELMHLTYEQFVRGRNDDLGDALHRAALELRLRCSHADALRSRDITATVHQDEDDQTSSWGGFVSLGR